MLKDTCFSKLLIDISDSGADNCSYLVHGPAFLQPAAEILICLHSMIISMQYPLQYNTVSSWWTFESHIYLISFPIVLSGFSLTFLSSAFSAMAMLSGTKDGFGGLCW